MCGTEKTMLKFFSNDTEIALATEECYKNFHGGL